MKEINPIKAYHGIFGLLVFLPFFTFGQMRKDAKEDKSIEIDPIELRVHMDDFFFRFSGIVEEAADSIQFSTTDRKIAGAALFWKMNAIPSAQQAIFTTNPLEALIDANILCIQMDQYFKDGAGKTLFGDLQPVAKRASNQLRNEIRELSLYFLTGIKTNVLSQEIQFFALNNPINSLYFNRKSVKPLVAELLPANKVKLKEMAEDINQSVKDLNNRINVYTDLLAKQIRWQSEYLVYETVPENFKKIPLDTLAFGFDSLINVVSEMPSLLDDQRVQVTRDLRSERALLIALLKDERLIMTQFAHTEIQSVLAEIEAIRLATLKDSEFIIDSSLEKSGDTAKSLVDYIFKKSLYLIGAIFLGLLVLVLLYKRK